MQGAATLPPMDAWIGTFQGYRRSAVKVVMLFAMILGASIASASNQAVALHVDIGKDVIYCDVQLGQNPQALAATLKDGTRVSFKWTLSVYEVKPYWFDSKVATIHIEHQVIPDLVTQKWLLADVTSGIRRHTSSLADAVDFLSRLQHFPVIDRSLLKSGKHYRLEIQLVENKGGIERGWWSRLWGHEQTTGTLAFRIP